MIKAKIQLGCADMDFEGKTPSEVLLAAAKAGNFVEAIQQGYKNGLLKESHELMLEYVIPAQTGKLTLEKLRELDFEDWNLKCLSAEETEG